MPKNLIVGQSGGPTAVISSSTVKEVARYGGDISKFVPEKVAKLVMEKIQQ